MAFTEYEMNYDMNYLYFQVNKKVASYTDNTNRRKQIPQPAYTLLKKWFLNPIPVDQVHLR